MKHGFIKMTVIKKFDVSDIQLTGMNAQNDFVTVQRSSQTDSRFLKDFVTFSNWKSNYSCIAEINSL